VVFPESRSTNESIEIDLKWKLTGKEKSSVKVVEFLAIIAAFEEWWCYLVGPQHHIQVITNHKNLIYFSTTRTLNRRQARLSTFLANYDFEISHEGQYVVSPI
jgi:hypothetical protein